MSSCDVDGRGVKQGLSCISFSPLASKVEQALLPLIPLPSSPSLISTRLSFLDTRGPAEASTGSGDDDVKDHLKRARKVH